MGEGSVLTFRVGDRRLAVAASEVAEVVREPRITRVPHAPESLAGVANVRGQVVPVVSVASLIGVAAAGGAGRRLIVLEREEPLGLAVDEVTGLADGTARSGSLVVTEGGESRVLALDEALQARFAAAPQAGARRARARAAPQAAEAHGPREVALLGFELAGQPYGLPLDQVREVIAAPRSITSLPRTDAAMLGVLRHRGRLLPVAATRVLLGLAPAPLDQDGRVVVAAIGDARVGLAVDRITAIIREPQTSLGPVPRLLNRAAGEAQIASMLRTREGRLVSVLAPERLFREDSVAQILEDGRQMANEGEDETAARGAVERVLIFQLGEEIYGLPLGAVLEVANLPRALSRVPNAPRFVAGVMSWRGQALPVIEQRQRFGVSAEAAAQRPRVLVGRVGELLAGFAVDAVLEIAEIPADQLQPTPSLTAEAGRLFDRVANLEDGRVVLLVRPEELLDRAEADMLAALDQGTTLAP